MAMVSTNTATTRSTRASSQTTSRMETVSRAGPIIRSLLVNSAGARRAVMDSTSGPMVPAMQGDGQRTRS